MVIHPELTGSGKVVVNSTGGILSAHSCLKPGFCWPSHLASGPHPTSDTVLKVSSALETCIWGCWKVPGNGLSESRKIWITSCPIKYFGGRERLYNRLVLEKCPLLFIWKGCHKSNWAPFIKRNYQPDESLEISTPEKEAVLSMQLLFTRLKRCSFCTRTPVEELGKEVTDWWHLCASAQLLLNCHKM